VLRQLGGLQQEGATSVMDLLEGRERRFVVGGELGHYWHEIALLRERLEGGEVGLKMEWRHARQETSG
jgi:hypothetical protein